MSSQNTISACLVVYNEEKIIERCLKSIKEVVDEIIVVHDGECSDKTIEIAKKYTNKVFIRDHVGIMEAHLVFAFEQVESEWIFRIDADEYMDVADFQEIKKRIEDPEIDGLILKWELWNGKKVIMFPGLQKMCLVRRKNFHYCGIPHQNGWVDGKVEKLDIFLHHRPTYNNIAWSSFMRKTRQWVPVHASYFFPEQRSFSCFNTTPDVWLLHIEKVRAYIWYYVLIEPIKMSLGQLKNGLYMSVWGWSVSIQQFVYYLYLYWRVWQIERKKA